MRKVMMIGLIVALACSCQTPTIKDPVRMYQLSMPREKALSARRNFDIKSDPRTVAERVEEIRIPGERRALTRRKQKEYGGEVLAANGEIISE